MLLPYTHFLHLPHLSHPSQSSHYTGLQYSLRQSTFSLQLIFKTTFGVQTLLQHLNMLQLLKNEQQIWNWEQTTDSSHTSTEVVCK